MSRDAFGAHIDTKENKVPQWIRRLQSAVKHLRTGDWMTEMPIEKRERYERAVEAFKAELEEIAR